MHEQLQSFIDGGISGAVARTSTAPLERVKIMRQIHDNYANKSIWSNLTRIYQREGVIGFYRGNGANLSRIVPQQAVLFGSYQMLDKCQTLQSPLIKGAIAGWLSLSFIYPMKLARTKLTVQSNKSDYRGLLDVFRKTSVRGLYRGYSMASVGTVPFHAVNFQVYHRTREHLGLLLGGENRGNFVAGCLSASAAVLVTYPSDLMARKYQLSGTRYNKQVYRSLWDCFRQNWDSLGWRGMYRGMLTAHLRMVPANGVAFAVFHALQGFRTTE